MQMSSPHVSRYSNKHANETFSFHGKRKMTDAVFVIKSFIDGGGGGGGGGGERDRRKPPPTPQTTTTKATSASPQEV